MIAVYRKFSNMPRGKLLTYEEKLKIKTFKEAGLSNREIARRINRSHHLVNNFVNLGESYGKNHPKGGNKKLTQKEKSLILTTASSGNLTAGQIKSDLSLTGTKRRVQQILSQNNRYKWTKMAKKPPLTQTHIESRLKFAKTHMTWDEEWKHVIFSDEKKFNLDGPDGLKYYWHDLRRKHSVTMSRNFGGGTIMVWAAFSYFGKTPICFISTKMNSAYYITLLEEVLIEYGETMPHQDWIFQQDNAAVHSSKVTKQWFQEKNIAVMSWPARSPDMNPMENLWGILSREVYGNCKQYNNITELKTAIKNAWSRISDETVQKLVCSMKNRVFELITNKGGNTKY